jgi:hypothetical protein
VTRVYGVVDNLPAHRMTDVLLFGLAHPRWEFVLQPEDAPDTRYDLGRSIPATGGEIGPPRTEGATDILSG